MIVAFVSVFLGLMAGPRAVEVAVGEPVAQVEVLLDGAAVGVLAGEPWSLEVDFGAELAPHQLVAVARDLGGRELGRAEQWINLPRRAAEAQILLESEGGGSPRTARLVWSAALRGDPQEISVTFDGEPLVVADPRRIPLPEYDPRGIHVLRAELRFPEAGEAVAEAAFGGVFGVEVTTEMQALAVALEEDVQLPPAAELSGWLERRGAPLDVRVVESGPAEVVLVVDLAAGEALRQLARSNVVRHSTPTRRPKSDPNLPGFTPQRGPRRWRVATTHRVPIPPGLHPDDRLRCVRPVPGVGSEPRDPYTIFPVVGPLTVDDGGIFEIMTRAAGSAQGADAQRLADAVAIAGIQAYASHRRRIVVLVVGNDPVDGSRFALPAVRRYLSRLRVPLQVWSIADLAREVEKRSRRGRAGGGSTPPAPPRLEPPDLGPTADISSVKALKAAISDLRRQLEAQHILWIDGHHLPQQMEISTPVAGVRWAGS